MRWPGAHAGESAAPWIHLLAATALLYVVLPRLVLALASTLVVWRRALRAPMPPTLVRYFRRRVRRAAGGAAGASWQSCPTPTQPVGRGAVGARRDFCPPRWASSWPSTCARRSATARRTSFIEHLAGAAAARSPTPSPSCSRLAATPEDQNHGRVIAGVRDWLARSRRQAAAARPGRRGPLRGAHGRPAGLAPTARRAPRRLGGLRGGARPPRVLPRSRRGRRRPTGGRVERLRAARWRPAPA